MKKRNIVFISAGVIVVVAVGVAMYVAMRPATAPAQSLSRGMTYGAAKRLPVADKCLVANQSLDISAGDRRGVEIAAMSHLYDVPAGTNVDVEIASYSQNKVTGSDRYEGDYGSYNFTMSRKTGASWHFTSFERCS